MPLSASDLLAILRQDNLLPREQLQQAELLSVTFPSGAVFAAELEKRGWLTQFQGYELFAGRASGLVMGSYVLLDRLGAGGMGEVFRARHRILHRLDALKRILPGRLDSAAVERFLREARAVAMLSHPNVVQVYDAGEANGNYYLAMELLRGVDLAKYLKHRGSLPVAEAVECVRQACEGMQHAHEKGLVHRDLKPANLWLTQQRQIKILDLGLALVANTSTLTQAGDFFGTPDYAAPEQVQDSHSVDIRADVYSLGCTLYHLLAGRPPYARIDARTRHKMHTSDKEPPPIEEFRDNVPPEVADVVRKMMAKRREERYQTPGEAVQALAALLPEGHGPPATQQGRGSGLQPPLPAPVARAPGSGWEDSAEKSTSVAFREPSAAPPTTPPAGAGPRPRSVGWLLGGAIGVLLLVGVSFAVVLSLSGNSQQRNKDETALGDTFSNSIGMKFVRVRAGSFRMGSPAREKDRSAQETEHEVTITKDFYLGVYEVTQKQYKAVMGNNPSHFCSDGEGKNAVRGMSTDDFPVEQTSWKDAQEFMKELNSRAEERDRKVTYRLPTEAEWEYACRGGPSSSSKPFHFDEPSDSLPPVWANFNCTIPYNTDKGEYLRRTRKVGSCRPNRLGLYDVHGNVSEWCSDWYDEKYYSESPSKDPRGPDRGTERICRGGGFDDSGCGCRAAFRLNALPSARNDNLGFRVVAVVRE